MNLTQSIDAIKLQGFSVAVSERETIFENEPKPASLKGVLQ